MIDTKSHGEEGQCIGRRQAVDTGMAMTLICLIAGLVTHERNWFIAALVLLVVNMTAPMLYRLPARAWFGFSHLLGTVMSKVILSVIFFGVVTPLALLRRVLGHDPMALRQWKKGDESVFVKRDHHFTAKEIENPF
ncbi:SxtJ family membrane protein [Salidesulfovibrio brasiliensis]|uniref:SxtJ family membrane protein n=1 Tax=Salidesulfovibrio brasiliensis TaxID=221711 RepID=UPI0006D21F07|nr:SxtJ family membrane protein [Salidesulfovibrio brasiliensis]